MNLDIFPGIDVHLRKSTRARQFTLRVSSLDGKVSLTTPHFAKTHQISAFLKEKEPWLRQRLSEVQISVKVTFGTLLPVMGRDVLVERHVGLSIILSKHKIYVPEKSKIPAVQLRVFLKQYARQLLSKKSAHYAEKLGVSYSKLSLRDVRSCWGSCSDQGALMFSWRLIMAPPEVLDYVAAHEVVHLLHMDHTNRFWTELKNLFGDFKQQQSWLRENGSKLHRYQFSN